MVRENVNKFHQICSQAGKSGIDTLHIFLERSKLFCSENIRKIIFVVLVGFSFTRLKLSLWCGPLIPSRSGTQVSLQAISNAHCTWKKFLIRKDNFLFALSLKISLLAGCQVYQNPFSQGSQFPGAIQSSHGNLICILPENLTLNF